MNSTAPAVDITEHSRLRATDDVAETPMPPAAPVEAVRQPLTRHALVLGMITALGAFGIDTYLPAFPAIERSLHASEGAVEASLVSYFVALAIGQLIYGPLSDRYGRKRPLLTGFALFVLAGIAASVAPTVGFLIAARFVQGLGACAGMVLARAVVRDLRSGEEAARLFALMILVLGVSPLLAPIVGSLLIAWGPWQAVFWFLAGLGAVCWLLVAMFLEETNPPARRSGGVGQAFGMYATLLRDRPFMATTLVGGFSQGALFAYLAGSSIVYIKLRGISPTMYSALFALNAVGLIGFAQFNVLLMRRFGKDRLLRGGTLVQSTAAVLLFVSAIAGFDSVLVLAALLFVALGAQGIIGPTSTVTALEPHAANAGAASALMGAIQFGCGAGSSALVSAFANGTSLPMTGVIAVFASAGVAIVYLTRGTATSAKGTAFA